MEAGPLSDRQLDGQKPWWQDPLHWETRDPYLEALSALPVRLPSPIVDAIDLTTPSLNTLRGPRQVGESTDLRLPAGRALREGIRPQNEMKVDGRVPLLLRLGPLPALLQSPVPGEARRSRVRAEPLFLGGSGSSANR
jgi:hypothetical protein